MSANPYNAALLSNFTIKGLEAHLKKAASRYGIDIAAYVGEYGQWQQEILGEKLYDFKPDIIYLIVDFEDTGSQLDIIDQLGRKTPAKIIVCNKVIDQSSVGANHALAERFKGNSQILVFDFNAWLESIGKEAHWNTKYRSLGDMRLAPHAFESFAQELGAYLIPLAGKTKKCLVLDLDNTLWGGIIGEDGLTGIKLAPTGEGALYYDFQKTILKLKKRGIILAIASSNNEADAKEVFSRHEHMLLKEDDFAASRINWENKADNLRALAGELNIGLDALVFIDDDPRNRELVAEVLPEVEALDVHALSDYKGFTSFGLTREDKKRAAMYTDEKKRRQFKEASVNLNSFLKGLKLAIVIEPLSDSSIARAAQLTQKTNQFNLTTHRYQEEDIKKMMAAGAKIWILDVLDKFGQYGLTGLIIAREVDEHWEVDTLLMSCRVLGKRVEEEFFGRVLDRLKKEGAKKVIGKYVPTAKNAQVKDFYQKFGFSKREGAKEDIWERDLRAFNFVPLDFINTVIKNNT